MCDLRVAPLFSEAKYQIVRPRGAALCAGIRGALNRSNVTEVDDKDSSEKAPFIIASFDLIQVPTGHGDKHKLIVGGRLTSIPKATTRKRAVG